MQWIKEYLISIIAAGIICGICVTLTQKNKACSAIIKMLGGIFLAVTLVAPIAKIQLEELTGYFAAISVDADALALEGSIAAQDETNAVIKHRLETYILDKADALGVQLDAVIELSDSDVPMPRSVKLSGAVSPYQKRLLSEMIADELGIPEGQQIWN